MKQRHRKHRRATRGPMFRRYIPLSEGWFGDYRVETWRRFPTRLWAVGIGRLWPEGRELDLDDLPIGAHPYQP